MRLFLLALMLLLTTTSVAQDATCDNLAAVAWLEGLWEAEDAVRRTVEEWTVTTEQTMEGEGRVYRKDSGAHAGSESLRLVEMGGEVFYLAKTRGNELPIAFRLVTCEPGMATFENPDHDFPQRLVYRRSDESLHVDVSDLDGNGFRLEFVRKAIQH